MTFLICEWLPKLSKFSKRELFIIVFCGLLGCVQIPPRPNIVSQLRAQQLLDYGTIALREGRLREAEEAFVASHTVIPGPAALDALGCLEFRRGNFVDAGKLFRTAYENDNSYTEAMAHLGILAAMLGELHDAETLLNHAVMKHPEQANYHRYLATVLDQLGKKSDNAALESSADQEFRTAKLLQRISR